MKSCPNCKRTFDDTMSFCLIDGSVLYPPFDPSANQSPDDSRNNEPPPTEKLNPAPTLNLSVPTIVQPKLQDQLQQASPDSDSPLNLLSSPGKKSNKFYVGLTLTLLSVGILGTILFFAVRSLQCPTITVTCIPNENYAICYVTDEQFYIIGYDRNLKKMINSFQALAILQRPTLPEYIKVNWTVSSGRIVEEIDKGNRIRIDTTGYAGREIIVNTTLTGYGLFCANKASTSFIAK